MIFGVEYYIYLWLLLLTVIFSVAFNAIYLITKDKRVDKKTFVFACLKVAGAVFVVLAIIAIIYKGAIVY